MDEYQRQQNQQQAEQTAVYNSAIIPYITAMSVAGRMLDQRVITRKEFLTFENKMLQKYGLPKCSLYRDFHLLYPLDQR